MKGSLTDHIPSLKETGGGRIILLFLLFLVSIYTLITSGMVSWGVMMMMPLIIIAGIIFLKKRDYIFFLLLFTNFYVMDLNREGFIPFPPSLLNELLEILLIYMALIRHEKSNIEIDKNLMLYALLIWFGFCCLEYLNNPGGLGINTYAWWTGARLMCFSLIYAFIVCSIYVNTPKKLLVFIFIWAIFVIYSALWCYKQQQFGFTVAENAFLMGPGRATHFMNGGSLIRYFSCFTDAANFGCHTAAAGAFFTILAITQKIKRLRIFFLVTAAASTWAMFQSGTRTGIFCLMAGIMVFITISKSAKVAVPVTIIFIIFASILMFTKIGDSNQQIRRMRTAFDSNDASANVRTVNKQAIAKYMQDVPWGMGIGMDASDIPVNNKLKILSMIPPDSEYVYIWVRTGKIGITIFVITTLLMIIGASYTVLFRIKSRSLSGIGAAFISAFISIHLGGYANQVLMQFPNVIIFYGGLSLVYVLPQIESQWVTYEEDLLAKEKERKRLKAEKKKKYVTRD